MEHDRSPQRTDESWLRRVCGETEMGLLVAGFRWDATPLGPVERWSLALRGAVTTCMTTRFPMLVTWGPRLTMVYNDGYRAMLGSQKHPAALGSGLEEAWGEIWDDIGPLCEGVMATGVASWNEHQRLLIDRNGYLEEATFTSSYSPLFDEDGAIAGVLNVASETTDHLLATGRLSTLADLGAALAGADHVTDVGVRAVTALGRNRDDLRSVDVFLTVGDDLVLVASNRRTELRPPPPAVLGPAVRGGVGVAVGGGHGADGGPVDQYLLPIGHATRAVSGALVVATNPHRPFDDGYRRFIGLVGTAIGTALEQAYRHAVEVGEYRHISDTLQQAMLQPASDLPTVAARYLPAAGNLAVGGDWYDVIDLGDQRRAIVVGDCVGHGLGAATAMGQLRSVARAMLLDGRDPAATLEGLDAFAASVPNAYCATAVCAVIDRKDDRVVYSRAGHPPPLVVSGPSETSWLDAGGGVPLAATPGTPRTNAGRQLTVDDTLVFYSDGLVERRNEPLDAGLRRLAAAAAKLHGASVQAMADGLLREVLQPDGRDDVVVVVKHLPRSEPERQPPD